jgi:hypothetical protein
VLDVLVRPEALEVASATPGQGVVDERTFLGSLTRMRVTLDDGAELLIDAATRRDLPANGGRVSVRVISEDALVAGPPTPAEELGTEDLPPRPDPNEPPADSLRDGLL